MPQKPIATMRMSDDGKPDIALEIFREPEDMHNRYAILSDTKEMYMYCEMKLDIPVDNTKLIFHRGGKDGPIIGTADSCPQKPHQTDIHLVSPNVVIPFKHSHVRFEHGGKGYCWNRKVPNELIEEGSEETKATFEPSVFEGNRHRIHSVGKVVSTNDDLDIVVMTVMLMEIREEQMMGPHQRHWMYANEMGTASN